jgi:hypothetical protein
LTWLTAGPVDLFGSAPRFGAPQRQFEAPLAVTREWRYDVTRDGEKFLFVLPVQEARRAAACEVDSGPNLLVG